MASVRPGSACSGGGIAGLRPKNDLPSSRLLPSPPSPAWRSTDCTVGARVARNASLGREVAERLLPRAEAVVHDAVGSEALAVAGGVQPEAELRRRIVGCEREIPRVVV